MHTYFLTITMKKIEITIKWKWAYSKNYDALYQHNMCCFIQESTYQINQTQHVFVRSDHMNEKVYD